MNILLFYRSIDAKTVLGLFIVPLTLLLQSFALGHILFYKLKFRNVDNRVHPIQLNQANAENSQGENERNKNDLNSQMNTKPYNEILFNISTIISWLSVFIFSNVLLYCLNTISKQNYHFIYYANDFIPLFLTNIVLPSIFYFTSHKSRIFFRQLILCN